MAGPRRLAGHIHGLIMAWPPLRRAATRMSLYVLESRPRSPTHILLGPARGMFRGQIGSRELLRLVDALEAANVGFWLAGGWGVDALVGNQTRRHDDLDVVIDDFETGAPTACRALAALGFRLLDARRHAIWMPDRWHLRNDTMSQVDLLSIDWDLLSTALGVQASNGSGSRSDALRRVAFAEGTVDGRSVPCLSARVQVLYHSGFEPRAVHRHDVELVRSLIER